MAYKELHHTRSPFFPTYLVFQRMMVGVIEIALTLFFAIAFGTTSSDAYVAIGVNFGRLGNDLPSASQVIDLYKQNDITKMRLFDPDPSVLEALRNSGIAVTLGIRNEDLATMASSSEVTQSWFATYIQPYIKDIVFPHIVVGNEVIPGPLGNFVLPVMQNLQSILTANNLAGISVTTAIPMTALTTSYPPSQSEFADSAIDAMTGILRFLSSQASPLLVNVYPYFAYASDTVNIRLDYAQLNTTEVVNRDGELGYTNMLDAMLDSFFWAMEKAGGGDVDIVVSESGWPSDGNGELTTTSLAATYNQNFVKRITSMKGTPKKPDAYIEGFVFALFNENLKPDGVEQNFGLFYPNMQPVYSLFPISD